MSLSRVPPRTRLSLENRVFKLKKTGSRNREKCFRTPFRVYSTPPQRTPQALFGYPGYCLDTGGGTPQKGSFGVPPGPGRGPKPGFPTRGTGKKGTFGVPHPQKPVFDHFLGKKGGKTPQKGGFLGKKGGFWGVFRGQKSHFRVPRLPGRVPPPTLPRLNPMGNRPGVPKNPIWGTWRDPKK